MLSDVVVEGGGGEKQGQSRCSVMWCGGWRWRAGRKIELDIKADLSFLCLFVILFCMFSHKKVNLRLNSTFRSAIPFYFFICEFCLVHIVFKIVRRSYYFFEQIYSTRYRH